MASSVVIRKHNPTFPRRLPRQTALAASEEGSSLIELAVTMPVLLLMVFGFVNFALVMYGMGNATYAAHFAQRYASTHSAKSYIPTTQTDINTIVQPFLVAFPNNTAQTTIAYTAGNTVGSTVTIGIKLTYTISLPGLTLNAFSVLTQATGVIIQ